MENNQEKEAQFIKMYGIKDNKWKCSMVQMDKDNIGIMSQDKLIA